MLSLVYVDDILITEETSLVDKVKSELLKKFKASELSECKQFLGVQVKQGSNGIFLSQQAYIGKVIQVAGMTYAKPTQSPLQLSHPLYEEKMSAES